MAFFEKVKYGVARILGRKPCAIRGSRISKKAAVGNGAKIVNCTIDRYTYIYGSSVVSADVGAFCSIAAGCTIGGGKHPTNWVSSSPVFYKGRNVLRTNFSQNEFEEYAHTIIGNDVWIGSKCLIKGGVTIGDGAVIGMGSVVTHDVPPYEIWAGNPAKLIRKRFDERTIEKLIEMKWWNFSDEELSEIGDLFKDPQALICWYEEINHEDIDPV